MLDPQPILSLRGIHKKYSELFSLTDINIDLFAGEVHIIVGENGSGKSNIMKIIAGVEKQNAGEIILDGSLVAVDSPRDAKKMGILFISQSTNLFPNLSVAENVFYDKLNNYIHVGIDYFELRNHCRQLLDELCIRNIDANDKVSRLNFAQKQLVEIMKAYASDARIFLLDEPSSALTGLEREILFDVLCSLKNKNVAILYSSHRLDEIKKIGSRISVIRNGQIVYANDVKDVDKKHIVSAMTGTDAVFKFPKIKVEMGAQVLDIKNLSYENVLKNVSFSLKKREILGVTGLMGAGKTCLAQCICGEKRVTEGVISINGKDVSLRTFKDAIRAGVAYIPEGTMDGAMFDRLDVAFNMSISSLDRFTSPKNIIHKGFLGETVRKFIARFNITNARMDSLLYQLSGGNRQKINIAKWILKKEKIYVMDEPTRGLDIVSKVDIYNCMDDLVSKGASILFISSDIEELIGMCDRILVLSEGSIACNLSTKNIKRETILEYLIQ